MAFENCELILELLNEDTTNDSVESIAELLKNPASSIFEHKVGDHLNTFEKNSFDCIISGSNIISSLFSDNKKTKAIDTFFNYLKDITRILKEKHFHILYINREIIVLIKEKNPERKIDLSVLIHGDGTFLEPFFSALDFIRPIKNIEYVEYLISQGYTIIKNKDPKNDPAKHLKSFKKFIEKGKMFATESWLKEMKYQFVEPSTFTLGHRIAYKMINDFPDERFNSNFSIIKEDKENVLYLKKELPKL